MFKDGSRQFVDPDRGRACRNAWRSAAVRLRRRARGSVLLRWPARAAHGHAAILADRADAGHRRGDRPRALSLFRRRGARRLDRRARPQQRQQCRPGDLGGDAELARRAAAAGRRALHPGARPRGDPDRGLPGQCGQGHADRELHRRARAPERADRHHVLLQRPGDDLHAAADLLYRGGDDRGLAVRPAAAAARTARRCRHDGADRPAVVGLPAVVSGWHGGEFRDRRHRHRRRAGARPAAGPGPSRRRRLRRRLGVGHRADAGGADLRRHVLPAERRAARRHAVRRAVCALRAS